MRDALVKIPGVEAADVSFANEQAEVKASASVTRAALVQAITKHDPELACEAKAPQKILSRDVVAKLDIQVISKGKAVRIEDHLAKGKYTIVDYYADWCGPCRALAPKLEILVQQRKDVAMRQVDLVNWKSEAAQQATKLFKLPNLPYIRVYGPDGKFVGAASSGHYEKVLSLLNGPSK